MKQERPLMESIDYPNYVNKMVKDRLAAMDMQADEEMSLYLAQDVEDYLLDAHKQVSELTEAEKIHIDNLIRERM